MHKMAKTTVSNLDEQVRESLRTRIVSGDLGGGAHLSELKLSKEFNVSRTPIREALCALAADGLVEMVPHRGAFVRTVESSESADQHYIYNQMSALAARVAAERSGMEDWMNLENAINALDSSNTSTFVASAEKVNETIMAIASSPSLNVAINSVQRRMISSAMWLEDSSKMEEIKKEYSFLLGAFKRQKGDAAEKTMRQIMTTFSQRSSSNEEMNVGMMNTTSTETTLNA